MPSKPRKGETQEEYLARAIPKFIEEGYQRDQAAAIAYRNFRDRNKKNKN